MIVRTLKLKPSKTTQAKLESWLFHLASVWNWGIRKIELDAADKVYHSEFAFQNLLAGHSVILGVSSHTIQATLTQSHRAWQRCFQKLSKRPRFKGRRNPLNSIPFPDPIKRPTGNNIRLRMLGRIGFHRQDLPPGTIKCARVIRRPSGWYVCLWIDTVHKFPVKPTDASVGIDPGFSTLLTLSDGTKFENPRELRKSCTRLAQAQRSGNRRLAARVQERQRNRRRDRNHKISRKLVEDYQNIFYSKDNFLGLAKVHGKSVREAGLGRLISTLAYKAVPAVRRVVPVSSRFTTMTCSTCGALSGPTGLSGLAVRHWECACGALHDRDVNAAINILNAGAGSALKEAGNSLNQQELANVAHDQSLKIRQESGQ